MKPYTKTRVVTLISCLIIILIASFVQLKGQSFIEGGCSYLDNNRFTGFWNSDFFSY
tara:strand:+ start:855 stop:1025 length:171 start_codon:yes stop_codon:yes gene_type:complete